LIDIFGALGESYGSKEEICLFLNYSSSGVNITYYLPIYGKKEPSFALLGEYSSYIV